MIAALTSKKHKAFYKYAVMQKNVSKYSVAVYKILPGFIILYLATSCD
jgi:hypothetical protein